MKAIDQILDADNFDIELALVNHRARLEQKQKQISTLIQIIDSSLLYMKGDKAMTTKDLFEGFDEAKQAEYEKEVEKRWGDKYLNESKKR